MVRGAGCSWRGRAMYRLVRVGLLPAGGGFGSLIDHAIKMERARRALEQDMAEYRAMGERKLTLTRKLEDLATLSSAARARTRSRNARASSARRGRGSQALVRQSLRNVDQLGTTSPSTAEDWAACPVQKDPHPPAEMAFGA